MKNIVSFGVLFSIFATGSVMAADPVTLGPRPFYLVADMDSGPLKEKLEACFSNSPKKSTFSIGHRGASLQFPEHTKESYVAAAQMGAGIIECDVTFTKDKQLVCRHSQNDLHTTTDVLAYPKLAEKCTVPFTPANPQTGEKATAECRTSDFTLDEFRQLKGKMDGANPMATTPEEYMNGTADFRTDLYASRGTLMTHAESIALLKSLGVKMTPELKEPKVPMPYNGFTQRDYAQKMIDEYKEAGVKALDVYPQSFNTDDVDYWVANEPEFGQQSVYLDSRMYDDESWKSSLKDMKALKESGVGYISPPLYALVTVDEKGNIAPSDYAKHAKAAGLGIITWTLERSGHLGNGGGWYYQSVKDVINNDGDVMTLLDVLAQDVGVVGVFSDWPATTTFYANCMGLE
ncbi:glycerophosphodiester phosphodiesterase [Enterovibrio norvegicus FF-33]|uniref:glycerophosphodiester phosphodiesterase family protein n=1 Tax=Enterovibrio norvegicus TaxID=188144 RepID=UPI0002D7F24E|nr:glycerophosphodiester phosphodiesterase family protein [Enterovibrio norvegicus]OEE65707.1 glycerophosphodiester phosphodiesterase [Enterovibrio norvegicus FF-33]OEE90127.1 glycerophosphodiester phosphodiesterase [Enterovibrio norvegicus FF-162]